MIMTNATVKDNPRIRPYYRWKVAELFFNQPDRKEVPNDQIIRDALTYLKSEDSGWTV